MKIRNLLTEPWIRIAGMLVVGSLLLVSGCKKESPPQSDHEKAIAGYEKVDADIRARYGANADSLLFRQGVYHALATAGVTNLLKCNISHEAFQPVDEDWVTGAYSVELNRVLFDVGVLNQYRGVSLNCEDFALGATFVAKALHLKAPGRVPETSPAFGYIYYRPEDPAADKAAHAINFALLKNGSVLFYEPQSRLRVRLTASEIASIYFWEL